MSFSPNPENIKYQDVVDILVGIKEDAYKKILALEEKIDFSDPKTDPKNKETYCYWAGIKEGLSEALFYVWDAGQQRELKNDKDTN
jgi:hypothetical protein